ncbi:MAG: hypothetical protein V3T90_07625, partial [Anaerolineae bacterium]
CDCSSFPSSLTLGCNNLSAPPPNVWLRVRLCESKATRPTLTPGRSYFTRFSCGGKSAFDGSSQRRKSAKTQTAPTVWIGAVISPLLARRLARAGEAVYNLTYERKVA